MTNTELPPLSTDAEEDAHELIDLVLYNIVRISTQLGTKYLTCIKEMTRVLQRDFNPANYAEDDPNRVIISGIRSSLVIGYGNVFVRPPITQEIIRCACITGLLNTAPTGSPGLHFNIQDFPYYIDPVTPYEYPVLSGRVSSGGSDNDVNRASKALYESWLAYRKALIDVIRADENKPIPCSTNHTDPEVTDTYRNVPYL